jgi:hypothetical protein
MKIEERLTISYHISWEMYALKVPLRALVECTSWFGRCCRVSFYFDRGKLVEISALVTSFYVIVF